MKHFLSLAITFALTAALTACNSDTSLDPNISLYQDYVVEYNNGKITAYANFHKHNQNGERVKLNNGASITVNGLKMEYYKTYDAVGAYNYVMEFPANTKTITFDFQRNASTHLITESEIGKIPEFTVDECDTITNGKQYWITISDGQMYPNISLQAVLVSQDGMSGYNASADSGTKSFRFNGVRSGFYTLYTTLYRTETITATDGNAKGSLKTARIVTTYNVKVE